jgi:transcriptional regulator with XRE-family HTH domain
MYHLRNFGDIIARERKHQGLSLRALAERSKTSHSYLVKLEQATIDPRLSTIERIFEALGIDLIGVEHALASRLEDFAAPHDEEYLVNIVPEAD